MQRRIDAEQLCRRFDCHADETLGPAALLTALLSRDEIYQLTTAITDYAPNAVLLNMTNPLSSVTSLMRAKGAEKSVGLCELPSLVAKQIADTLQIPINELDWSYSGLNHRGFVHTLPVKGQDVWADFLAALGDSRIDGIDSSTIRSLGAVPTKYFRLFTEPFDRCTLRGTFLEGLRNRILSELVEAPFRTPPSLELRYMEWYPQSVVPMIVALSQSQPARQMVNLANSDGLVREQAVWVSSGRISSSDRSFGSFESRVW